MNLPLTRRRVLLRCRIFLVSTFFIGAMTGQVDFQVHAADPGIQAAATRVTQIIAHRGASAERPECTLAAIQRAIEVGATAVEVDVRTSSDGKLFLLHDETLDRTTNGVGPANTLTLADLQRLDAGSWFNPEYRGEQIPSLIHAAQESRGRIDLLLDLKEQGENYDRKVADIIQKHGDPAKTIVGVRTVAQAKRFRRLLPKSRQLGLIPSVDSIESFAEVGVDTIRLWPRWLQDGDDPVKRVAKAGKRLHLNGTSGELDETLGLLMFGPDSISSDHPAQLRRTLDSIARTSISVIPGGLPPAPDDAFSIVVIPDTQQYRGSGTNGTGKGAVPLSNQIFDGWTDWIAANLERQRIVFVSHVGDIVDINNRAQWALARRCMDKLHGRVPYGISVGNHDMNADGDSSLFQEVFPKSRFTSFQWYGGCFEKSADALVISGNNANSVQLFETHGMKFIALHLECNAPDDVLLWANSILRRYGDRRAMITTHMGLGPRDKPKTARDYFDAPKGRMTWTKRHGKRGNSPQQMWDKCFKMHANLFLICCGDQSRTQALRQESIGQHGNTVHELLSDYGAGGLRVMRLIPTKNLIEVRTWDPLKRMLCESTQIVKDRNHHQFSISYEMKTVTPQ
jgi:glycerophosphoryl diester phosphodiesterase